MGAPLSLYKLYSDEGAICYGHVVCIEIQTVYRYIYIVYVSIYSLNSYAYNVAYTRSKKTAIRFTADRENEIP